MQLLGSGLLIASTILCTFTAFAALTQPVKFAQSLGNLAPTVDAQNEVRAQYGGFFLVVGVVNLLALTGVVSASIGYGLNTVIFAGLIMGRLLSLMLEGAFTAYTPVIRTLFVIDSVGLVWSLAALFLQGETVRNTLTNSGQTIFGRM